LVPRREFPCRSDFNKLSRLSKPDLKCATIGGHECPLSRCLQRCHRRELISLFVGLVTRNSRAGGGNFFSTQRQH
jgi:hypothetical protein